MRARERFAPVRGQPDVRKALSEVKRAEGTPVAGVIHTKLKERLQTVVGEDKRDNVEHPLSQNGASNSPGSMLMNGTRP